VGKNIYSWSIIIRKFYPAISAAVGGQEGMDCSMRLWMMSSINRIRHQLRDRPHHFRTLGIFLHGNIYIHE